MECLCPTQVDYQIIPKKAIDIFTELCNNTIKRKYGDIANYKQLIEIYSKKDSFEYKLNINLPTLLDLNDYIYAILYFNQLFNFIPNIYPPCYVQKNFIGCLKKHRYNFPLSDFLTIVRMNVNVNLMALLTHCTTLDYDNIKYDNLTNDEVYHLLSTIFHTNSLAVFFKILKSENGTDKIMRFDDKNINNMIVKKMNIKNINDLPLVVIKKILDNNYKYFPNINTYIYIP